MTSLLCNSCNSLEISSMIKTHDVGVLIIGVPENLLIFGESGSKAKIHMSDVIANRIEP